MIQTFVQMPGQQFEKNEQQLIMYKLGESVMKKISRDYVGLLLKFFPLEIALIIAEYMLCYKFTIERVRYKYWVHITPIKINTGAWFDAHGFTFMENCGKYIALCTTSSNIIQSNTLDHLVTRVNIWRNDVNKREEKQKIGTSCTDLLLNCIGCTSTIDCALCRQTFPLNQARIMICRSGLHVMICLQHNDKLNQMMYMYEMGILCIPGSNHINMKILRD